MSGLLLGVSNAEAVVLRMSTVNTELPSRQTPLLTGQEAAALLRCSLKTLRGHVASGALRYVIIGHGKRRPRRMFMQSDIEAFLESQARRDFTRMSVYKDPRTPYWQFDFQWRGHRFHGSTKKTTRREAEGVERDEREKAKQIVALQQAARTSLRLDDVFGRYWARCRSIPCRRSQY